MKYEIKDDLFKSVNNEWLEQTEIPSDRTSIGEFVRLDIENEKIVARLAKRLVKKDDEGKLIDQNLQNFARFYKLTANFEQRNQRGVEPLRPYLNEILNIQNMDELMTKYVDFLLKDYPLPIDFGVESDFLDSQKQTLYAGIASHILPDKDHYQNEEIKTKFLTSFKKMAKKLLTPYIDDVKQVNKLIKLTLQYDELIAKYSLTSLQKVRYTELYKPYKFNRIANRTKNFDFREVVSSIINKEVDEIVFSDDNFALNIDKLFSPKHFEKIIAWIAVKFIIRFSKYLDEKTRTIASQYSLSVSGQAKVENKNKYALKLALSYFNIPVGTYYGQKYLGAKAKRNIEKMVQNMIQVYKNNLENNTWLSKETIKKAIIKLNALGVHIGYPKELRPYYKDLVVSSDSIIENVFNFNKTYSKYKFSQYLEPINKNYWGMSPATVNAYYHPMYNHIVFPAAILNGAFYSINNTSSQNYGGIGAVIAHEISHAFDNNGANFDEKGNLNMWWTPEDFEKFGQKTKAMIDLFDGVETDYGKCNGTLTVSENIADAGGVESAITAAKMEKDYNAQEFFINWARVWKAKYQPLTAQRLLESDPHAPTNLRANIQAANRQEFIDAFNIKEGDGMFIPAHKRVKIW
ncbi:M13-type metalloendopeptidase [Mycoplasma sp. HS2188]|uniref:M13-type metalloendopeptidase n=1 Tax=Mycoplasma sp. HS2188 TaxID=2976765 RepID=UPI0021AA74B8|nr:M13 family metallopeptidase [Mycoplasma sp. HS2188]MCT4469931.1 M13 family metallopeptidase [Mycoplasma sp. HS2188]